MIDFVWDYLERKGVYPDSRQEQQELDQGIEDFLDENGIRPWETRQYHRNFVLKRLALVEDRDLKAYFLHYDLLRLVNQLLVEARVRGSFTPHQRQQLYGLLEALHTAGLGDRYAPMDDIKSLLGPLA